jgi:hypothetical protein
MLQNFSISSFEVARRLRGRSRLVPAIFVVTCVAVTAAAFGNYQLRGLARHPEDIKLFNLDHSHGSFRRLILSDSVTENATAGIALDPGDLPLMTHGWMRVAGQYFLMRRALERNAIESVDFFLVPDLLIVDVDNEAQGRIRHTYTDTLFTRREEIDDLRRAGDEEAGRHFVFFELAFKSLQPGPRELPPRTMPQMAAPRPTASNDVDDEGQRRIEGRARALTEFKVTPQNTYFLKRLAEACAKQDIACRLIIEPMPASLPRINPSRLRDLVPGVDIVDINDFAVFPDSAFRDGLHLRSPNWTAYYRTILAEKGLMKFAPPGGGAAPWNGDKIVVASGSNDQRLIRVSGFHALEPWGCWTDGTHAVAFVDLEDNPTRRNRLTLALTALIKRGPQRVAVSINGDERCSQIVTENGNTSLSCKLPDGVKGPTKIEISTSYASSPRDWGEADSRALGIGLRSVGLE